MKSLNDPFGKKTFSEMPRGQREVSDNSQMSIISGQWASSQVHTLPYLTDGMAFSTSTAGEIQFKISHADLSPLGKALIVDCKGYVLQAGFYWCQR